MAKDDIFYCDIGVDQLSTYRIKQDFMKYSERWIFNEFYKGLKLDEQSRMRTNTRTTISFKELKAVLLSKDMNLY